MERKRIFDVALCTLFILILWGLMLNVFAIENKRNPVAFLGLYTGNVGINTTSPSSKLDINSGANSIELKLRSSTGWNSGIQFWPAGLLSGTFSVSSNSFLSLSASTLTFTTDSSLAGGEAMRILTNGSVGVGTTAPGHKFEVSGGSVNIVSAGGRYLQADTNACSNIIFSTNTGNYDLLLSSSPTAQSNNFITLTHPVLASKVNAKAFLISTDAEFNQDGTGDTGAAWVCTRATGSTMACGGSGDPEAMANLANQNNVANGFKWVRTNSSKQIDVNCRTYGAYTSASCNWYYAAHCE